MAAARFAAVLFFSALALTAYAGQQARLTIQVQDQPSARIPGARIQLSEQSLSSLHTTTFTDHAGETALNLAPGTYTLDVTSPGFKHYRQINIELSAQANFNITVALQIANGSGPPRVEPMWGFQPRPYLLEFSIAQEPLASLPLRPQSLRKKRRH